MQPAKRRARLTARARIETVSDDDGIDELDRRARLTARARIETCG